MHNTGNGVVVVVVTVVVVVVSDSDCGGEGRRCVGWCAQYR